MISAVSRPAEQPSLVGRHAAILSIPAALPITITSHSGQSVRAISPPPTRRCRKSSILGLLASSAPGGRSVKKVSLSTAGATSNSVATSVDVDPTSLKISPVARAMSVGLAQPTSRAYSDPTAL